MSASGSCGSVVAHYPSFTLFSARRTAAERTAALLSSDAGERTRGPRARRRFVRRKCCTAAFLRPL